MIKRLMNILLSVLFCLDIYSFPKMVKIPSSTYIYDNKEYTFESVEVSEHKTTVGEWKNYLNSTNKNSLADFEHELRRVTDSLQGRINCLWPVFGITWLDAAEYCNWLSEKEHLNRCYTFKRDKNNKTIIITDYSADGYRMPTVSEWFYLSELWMNKDEDYYREVNILERKIDFNNQVPYKITEEKKNPFGVYDILGNIPEMCNNFYMENYPIGNYLKNQNGPNAYTPDPDQVYFKEALIEVRCILGGYYSSKFEYLKKNLLSPILITKTGFESFRVVKKVKY